MLGSDHPIAWQIREACLDTWPAAVIKSLGVLVNGARGTELLRQALAAFPTQHLAAQAGDRRRDRRQPQTDRDGGLTMPPETTQAAGQDPLSVSAVWGWSTSIWRASS